MKLTTEEFLAHFECVKQTSLGQYAARCPGHDDTTPSLSIHIDGDTALLTCHAGCKLEGILKTAELTKRQLYLKPSPNPGQTLEAKAASDSLTVEQLAAAKKLPASFLEDMGVIQDGDSVLIQYYLEDGSLASRHRRRTNLVAKEGSQWTGKRSEKVVPLGLDDLEEARKQDRLLLAEGETDALTLWYHGYLALGIPGANMVHVIQPEHLEDVGRVYFLHEPDAGGDTFARKLQNRLREIDYRGKVFEVNLSGFHDVNDLHKQHPRKFALLLEKALRSAMPIDLQGWCELDKGDDEVLPFPIEVFPAKVRSFLEEVFHSMACPPDFVGVPALAVAAAAIGNTRRVRLKPGWEEGPIIYAGCAGISGTVKSAALSKVAEPVHKYQGELMEKWESDMEEYRDKLAAWESTDKKERERKPTLPVPKRVVVADTTTEALAVVLSENRRGVLVHRDELTGWSRSMNQYRGGRGSDRQFWLSAWSGQDTMVDRKGNLNPVALNQPFVCVLGSMIPDMFQELLEERGRTDGSLERLLIAYPNVVSVARWTEKGVSEEVAKSWDTTIRKLFNLEMHWDGGPKIVELTGKGKRTFVKWYDRHAAEMEDSGLLSSLQSLWSKLRAYCARLSLVLHLLRYVCGEAKGESVDEVSVKGAIKLVDYFKSHSLRVHRRVIDRLGGFSPDAEAVVTWIIKHKSRTFDRRELWRHLRRRFGKQTVMDKTLSELESEELIRRGPVEAKGKGRKPSPSFQVHPQILPGR